MSEIETSWIVGGRKLKENEFIAKVQETLDENISKVLNEGALKLIDELEKNAPVGATRTLSGGVTLLGVNTTEDGYQIEILFQSEYHDYIDKGVEGVDFKGRVLKNSQGRTYKFKTYGMPDEAIKNLQKWIQAKGRQADAESKIAKSKGEKTKKKKRKMSSSESAARSLAFRIKSFGIKPRNFKAKSVNTVRQELSLNLRKATGKSFILQII